MVRRVGPLVDAVLLEVNGVGAFDTDYARSLQHLAQVAESRGIFMCVTTREPSGYLSSAEKQRLSIFAPYLVYLHVTDAAAEMKLAYLFGRGLSPAMVRKIMLSSLRGEITEETLYNTQLMALQYALDPHKTKHGYIYILRYGLRHDLLIISGVLCGS